MLFVTTPYLITQFIGNMNNFNVIYLLSAGGPLSLDYYQAGKTDLLDKFVSMRTRRNFKAHLAWDKEAGKVNFEFAPSKFPPRKPAAGAATKAGAATAGRASAAAKKAPAKKAAAPAKKAAAEKPAAPAAQTTLNPQAAWPFPTGAKP